MERMKEKIVAFRRKTITLSELEEMSPNKTYEQFASVIVALEKDNILQMIQARGRNGKSPSLAYHYRISKQRLHETYFKRLQTYRLKLNNAINLDAYFKLKEETWERDLPYIVKVNDYIEKNGFPKTYVPAPERSFALVGDEKWIEQKGEQLLHRIELWDDLKIMPVADPLMFAINLTKIKEQTTLHLIVENKTTYEALLPVLPQSTFATLIYGVGNKIVSSIDNFPNQYPTNSDAYFFYFGDIDYEGISIWHRLNEKCPVIPALPFYYACLEKQKAYGKTNQTKNEVALRTFLQPFSEGAKQTINGLLKAGAYYPQEVLKTTELQHILLETNWNDNNF